MKREVKVPVRMSGWRCDGVVLEPNDIERDELIDLIENKNTAKVSLLIEFKESKSIQMTETDFRELIQIVENYANPAAELKSRLRNKRYHKRINE